MLKTYIPVIAFEWVETIKEPLKREPQFTGIICRNPNPEFKLVPCMSLSPTLYQAPPKK
jgi:hypothetical protein